MCRCRHTRTQISAVSLDLIQTHRITAHQNECELQVMG